MKTTTRIILLFSFFGLFTHCNDIESVAPDLPYAIDIGLEVERTITGIVTDENNAPIVGASVELNGSIISTNASGYFQFPEAEVFSKHVYVKVTKPGYFLGSRSIVPTEGVQSVTIKMMPKMTVGEMDASTGGSVTFDDVQIDLVPGIVDAAGNTFTGNVKINASYIDPMSEDLNEIMPGNLRATSDAGETLLETFGMVGVELEDDNGNPLQLAPGSDATLRMPIPADLMNTAPSTIPLWHFDEKRGYWIEEGFATKVGNEYVGTVKHFSFWNCDIPVASTTSYGLIEDEAGDPMPNLKLVMSAPGVNRVPRDGRTCSKGTYGGIMPANIEMELSMYYQYQDIANGNYLETFVAKRTISPLANNAAIPTIVLTDEEIEVLLGGQNLVKLEGTVLDCDGQAMQEAMIFTSDNRYISAEDGTYSLLAYKNQEITLTAVATTPRRYVGEKRTIFATEANSTVDGITVCDPDKHLYGGIDQDDMKSLKVSYVIDGVTFSASSPAYLTADADINSFSFTSGAFQNASAGSQGLEIYLLDYSGPGTYRFSRNSSNNLDFYTSTERVQGIIPIDMTATITNAGIESGESGEITFSGTFEQWNASTNSYDQKSVSDGLIKYEVK